MDSRIANPVPPRQFVSQVHILKGFTPFNKSAELFWIDLNRLFGRLPLTLGMRVAKSINDRGKLLRVVNLASGDIFLLFVQVQRGKHWMNRGGTFLILRKSKNSAQKFSFPEQNAHELSLNSS